MLNTIDSTVMRNVVDAAQFATRLEERTDALVDFYAGQDGSYRIAVKTRTINTTFEVRLYDTDSEIPMTVTVDGKPQESLFHPDHPIYPREVLSHLSRWIESRDLYNR